MTANRCRAIVLPLLGLLALGLCGCDEKMPAWTGLNSPPTRLPGVASPSERIHDLKELAEKAPSVSDPAQREAICQDLARQIRREPDSILRGWILRALAAYGGPTTTAVLHVAVKDTDADVRAIVCDLWGRRDDAEAAQVLADVLSSDSNFNVRMAAARALAHEHSPIAVQALGTRLDDKDPAMQNRVMSSLQESTGKDLGLDVDRWRQYVKTGQVRDDRSWAQRIFPWYH